MTSILAGRHRYPAASARVQRGAVLYVALIMLVLLALIGIVGMQVAGMQERMAANYYAVNLAFQNAERTVREAECVIEGIENRTSTPGCSVIAEANISRNCDDGFDATQWLAARNLNNAPAANVRKIDECVAGESPVAMGVGPVGDVAPISIFQITAYNVDSENNATSAAAIDTVFKL